MIRHSFAFGAVLFSTAACQTHDRVIYEIRPPKQLRVPHPGDTPEIPLDTTSPPKPGATTPSTGGPTLPPAAQ